MVLLNPDRYGAGLAALVREERLNPLDAGKPNDAARPQLDELTVECAFAGRRVADPMMAQACLAGVWLYHNYLGPSHAISQSIPTPTGSCWHAIMHRREPDFDNSNYWFNRVGEHPIFPELRRAAAEEASDSTTHVSHLFLLDQQRWDPMAFVDLCEANRLGRTPGEHLCRWIQLREWELLFEYSFRGALGEGDS